MPSLIAPLASLASRGSRLRSRLLRRRSQTIRRVCSFLLHCSLRSLRLALGSRCLPYSLADEKRVRSLARPGQRHASLAQHGGARSDARSSTTFETTFGGRMIWGVTVTPWLALSAVGRCSSSAAAARPFRAGILAAELTRFRSAPHLAARNHVRDHYAQPLGKRDDIVRYQSPICAGSAAKPDALPSLSAVHAYRSS